MMDALISQPANQAQKHALMTLADRSGMIASPGANHREPDSAPRKFRKEVAPAEAVDRAF
jgi:hypothetical protein